jgi:hypothetical protein
MWLQVQEMLRIEKGGKTVAAKAEHPIEILARAFGLTEHLS